MATTKRLIKLSAVLLCLLLIQSIGYGQKLLGDDNDGNRTSPIHLIPILDADGKAIDPASKNPAPFSVRTTCGKCHNYDYIAEGWHFNGVKNEVDAGRPGEPWILQDDALRMQIPLGRGWKGCYNPQTLGIGPWDFKTMFGMHYPGGGYAEQEDEDNPLAMLKGETAGTMEINCFACHSGAADQDQSKAALMVHEQNFKWAPAASCGLADVSGSVANLDPMFDPMLDDPPVTMTYRKDRFNSKNEVFFNLKRAPDSQRCYFCHSNESQKQSREKGWTCDQDIHLNSGLNCTDCHRNGLDHMISRGEPSSGVDRKPVEMETLTCKGCHYGDERQSFSGGRLSAPRPKHVGLPIVHFEKLSCTACHSGPVPESETDLVRTSRMHKTGLHGKHGSHPKLPHVAWPVFKAGFDGKIAPHKMLWPAFWGAKTGDNVDPLEYAFVKETLEDQLMGNIKINKVNDWLPLSQEQIAEALKTLGDELGEDRQAVYIAGGQLYELGSDGTLVNSEHEAAEPYSWAIAHDVRPAQQALGAMNGCKDCHTNESPLFYSVASVDTPLAEKQSETVAMVDLMGEGTFIRLFNASFAFRPMLKILCLLICLALVGLLAVYALKLVGWLSTIMTGSCPADVCEITPHKSILYNGVFILVGLGALASMVVLAATGFYALFISQKPMGDYLLMVHVTMAPIFAGCILLLAYRLAYMNQFKLQDCFIILIKKMCFWATVVLALPVILSIILSMLPLFGSHGQEFLYHLHQLTTVLISITAAGYGVLSFMTGKKKAPACETGV